MDLEPLNHKIDSFPRELLEEICLQRAGLTWE